MTTNLPLCVSSLALLSLSLACSSAPKTSQSSTGRVQLPPPDLSHDVKRYSKVIGWPKGKTPIAPAGFTVHKFADGFNNPRWIHVLMNGDILIAEASTEVRDAADFKKAKATGKDKSQNIGFSANRITIIRDTDRDGKAEYRGEFLTKLNQPFGMLQLKDWLYVANTDGVMRFPYRDGQTRITAKGEKILSLPAGGYNNHWTRNLISNADQSKIYISVGSASNMIEYGIDKEQRRANILEINPDGSGERIFASGLRNPVGMDWAPGTEKLWTVVNERDNLGDELVPDYLTEVKEGGFYGWPFAYFGQNEDPRLAGERPDLVAKTLIPDVALGSHTASLGLAFYRSAAFPDRYQGGAFIGQHGSWNRSQLVGYKVVYVPFKEGRPAGRAEDFLTGFIANPETSEVYGRPVGVTVLPTGELLVADDSSNTVWMVKSTQ